jgi:hypothetical protein
MGKILFFFAGYGRGKARRLSNQRDKTTNLLVFPGVVFHASLVTKMVWKSGLPETMNRF